MLVPLQRRRADIPLLLAAVFAFLWAVARAKVQSVTMDEADTYLSFVSRAAPFQWYPFPNNHILNSALMRMFTLIFGTSHLTIRLPALIGAAIYIGICLYVCAILPASLALRLPLFLCLVYNPFVFDFLVAARGYSMSAGLLLCAAIVPVAGRRHDASPTKLMAACSLLAAFSFTANFSFAFANLAVLALTFLWLCRQGGFSWRLVAAAIVPGALVVIMIPLPSILHWPREQLYAGAMSLRQTLRSVIHWSLYELNPEVANPLMLQVMRRVENRLFPALGLVVAWRLAVLFANWRKLNETRTGWLTRLGAVLGGAAALATAMHWIAFHLFGLLMPLDRTALFYVPLCTLAVGMMAAIPIGSWMGRASYYACVSALSLLALHFVLSMRLTYFGEWRYDADMKSVYDALTGYAHDYCVDRAASDWIYTNSLNFYRKLSGSEGLAEFPGGTVLPQDQAVYVLHASLDAKFIETQKLAIVYRGESTDAVIAVRPGLARCR